VTTLDEGLEEGLEHVDGEPPVTTTDEQKARGVTPSSLLPTLPGHTYVDRAWFDAECERLFEHDWFCAVREDDLPNAGSFRTVTVGRESVLLTRTRRGEVRAFLNVCRHRGARICTEDAGEKRRSFQCPYHAWTYDFEGKLIAAPNLTSMPDVDRTEFGLKKVAVHSWLGYVWVSLAPLAGEEPPSFADTVEADLAERLGGLEPLAAYDVGSLSLGRRITYDVAANWKLIVENFMECYHCATIHPELTEVLPEFADGLAAQYFVGHGAEFGEEVAGFTVDGTAGFDPLPGMTDDQDRRYYAITVRPQVFVNLVPDHVIWHRMYPMGPDRTVVECDWLYAPGVVAAATGDDADPELAARLDASVELFHRVNAQDFEACERCQPAMGSRLYADGGVLVPSEHHIEAFHAWLRDRVEGSA
jgi:glycine betaine catabolism A